jgi:hypothetical protein
MAMMMAMAAHRWGWLGVLSLQTAAACGRSSCS